MLLLETILAKVAPCIVRMPRLFLIVPPGKRQPFDVAKGYRDMSCRLAGPEQLSIGDLEVLLGLIALAGRQTTESFRTTRRLTGRDSDTRLRQMQGTEIEVHTTCSELARELGRSAGGATWPFIKQSITRLSSVSVLCRSICGGDEYEAPLVRPIQADSGKGMIALALCPVLAAGVLGGPGEFIQIDMKDFRALQDRSGVACALYFCLHSRYSDQEQLMTVDQLVEFAYGPRISLGSRRKYRARVKEASQAIAGLEQWTVKGGRGGEFSFLLSRTKVAKAKSRRSMES